MGYGMKADYSRNTTLLVDAVCRPLYICYSINMNAVHVLFFFVLAYFLDDLLCTISCHYNIK